MTRHVLHRNVIDLAGGSEAPAFVSTAEARPFELADWRPMTPSENNRASPTMAPRIATREPADFSLLLSDFMTPSLFLKASLEQASSQREMRGDGKHKSRLRRDLRFSGRR